MDKETTTSQENKISTLSSSENEVNPQGSNVVATGKCDGSTNSIRTIPVADESTVKNVNVKEEIKDEVMEVSTEPPSNSLVQSDTDGSAPDKSKEPSYQDLKSELKSLQEKLADKNEKIEQLKMEHKKAITAAKRKQWCFVCAKEAIMNCCWNTSYCSVGCQAVHWGQDHKKHCQRKRVSARNQIAGS